MVIARETLLTPRDLPLGMPSDEGPADAAPEKKEGRENESLELRPAVEQLERDLIRRALEKCSGHQTHTAELLGLSERMLRYKLQKYRFK